MLGQKLGFPPHLPIETLRSCILILGMINIVKRGLGARGQRKKRIKKHRIRNHMTMNRSHKINVMEFLDGIL